MYKKIVCLSDQHIPYLDGKANEAVFKFLKRFKPHKIKLLGDVIDFWQISSFLKDPSRITAIQADLDATKSYLARLRDTAPQADFTYLAGNHEDRMRKRIWKDAPWIASIRDMEVDKLLNLEGLKIKFYREQTDVERDGEVLFTHGTIVSQDSAMTARRMLKKYGMSIIFGHVHRLGSYYETKVGGAYGAWENGCLCTPALAREWRVGFPNWQQGFTVVYMTDKRFIVNQVFISEGELLWAGRVYKG